MILEKLCNGLDSFYCVRAVIGYSCGAAFQSRHFDLMGEIAGIQTCVIRFCFHEIVVFVPSIPEDGVLACPQESGKKSPHHRFLIGYRVGTPERCAEQKQEKKKDG